MSFGRIIQATSTFTGTSTVGVEAVGQTVISLDNANAFGLDAGFVTISGSVEAYSSIDRENGTITLVEALSAELPAGTPVLAYPYSVQRWAFVQPDSTSEEVGVDAVWCLIPHNLAGFVANDGMREPEEMEKVEYERSNTFFKIKDVLDKQVQLNPLVIPDGAITETKISEGAITTPLLAANAVAAENIQGDAIDGMTITGATIQTLLGATAGIKLIENTIVGYDESGVATFVLEGDTGAITMFEPIITGGVYKTSQDGQRVQLSEKTTVVEGVGSFFSGLIEFFSGNANEVTPPRIVSINDNRLQIASGKFNPSPTHVSYLDLRPSAGTVVTTTPAGNVGMSVAPVGGGADSAKLSASGRGFTSGSKPAVEVSATGEGATAKLTASGSGGKATVSGGTMVDVLAAAINSGDTPVLQLQSKSVFDNTKGRMILDAAIFEFPNDVLVAPGMILMWAGASAPLGWSFCRGQIVPIATYPKLWAAFGSTHLYGPNPGGSSFYLPNFNARSPIGVGGTSGTGSTNNYDLGLKWGDERMEPHTHRQKVFTGAIANGGGSALAGMTQQGFGDAGVPANQVTASTGSAVAGMGNVHPVLGVNFIIKLG